MLITIVNLSVLLVALLHILFLVLEIFYWTRPLGRKVFGLNEEFARQSSALAANQGIYNGFLAAGLVWSVFAVTGEFQLKLFFLSCVVVAGIFGAMTVSRKIFFVQALPAIISVLLLFLESLS